MARTAVGRVVKEFLQTTTLHGFKYLCSPFYFDRVIWITWSVVSASCAGVLCCVLWVRFAALPALLMLRDMRDTLPLPLIAVCPSPDMIANMFIEHLAINDSETKNLLPLTLGRLLREETVSDENLMRFANLLEKNDWTLRKALMGFMPETNDIVKKCRWLGKTMPCDSLFQKKLTRRGTCYLLDYEKDKSFYKDSFSLTKRLTVVIDFSNIDNGYNNKAPNIQFLTKYYSEEWKQPAVLESGYSYLAQVSFMSIEDREGADELVGDACVQDRLYSRRDCKIHCRERLCGCSDPIRIIEEHDKNVLPPCHLSRMSCLLRWKMSLLTQCNCPPSCETFISWSVLDTGGIVVPDLSFDPWYAGLNGAKSIVLDVNIRTSDTQIFERFPTETWLSLLSSLGGVFNMFLGVGLFSALEVFMFILIRLPVALRKQPEMNSVVTII